MTISALNASILTRHRQFIQERQLGTANTDVQKAIASLGKLPRGLTVATRGLTQTLTDTLDSLQTGLIVAIIVIFLMLAANFQSFKMSFVVLLKHLPTVLFGSLFPCKNYRLGAGIKRSNLIWVLIMSVGVSISNAVLLNYQCRKELRKHNGDALKSAREAVHCGYGPYGDDQFRP